jgi:mono/diheme cytochrome c family protein
MWPTVLIETRPVQNRLMRLLLPFAATVVSLLVLAGCDHSPPSKPLDQLTSQESHGREVFSARCSQCHFDRSSQSLQGPALKGMFKKQYLPSGAPANDDRVTATILHGRSMMPPQGDIAPQDLNDLMAYLHTL